MLAERSNRQVMGWKHLDGEQYVTNAFIRVRLKLTIRFLKP